MQLQFVTYIFVNAMGKMKELFIKDIEDNARHITYDVVDEWEHFDDEYHYQKHLQKKAMNNFQQIIKTLCLTTAVLLSAVCYSQTIIDSFSLEYIPWGCGSQMFEDENPRQEWGSFEQPMPETKWVVIQNGVVSDDPQIRLCNNKPYLYLDVYESGDYHFEIHDAVTNQSLGEGIFYIE